MARYSIGMKGLFLPCRVGRLGLVVRRSAGKRKDPGSDHVSERDHFSEPAWPSGKALGSVVRGIGRIQDLNIPQIGLVVRHSAGKRNDPGSDHSSEPA